MLYNRKGPLMLIFHVRTLGAGETYALRRAVSADGRTDLLHVRHDLDAAPGTWHLGAVDGTERVIVIASFYRVACPACPDARARCNCSLWLLTQRWKGVGSVERCWPRLFGGCVRAVLA